LLPNFPLAIRASRDGFTSPLAPSLASLRCLTIPSDLVLTGCNWTSALFSCTFLLAGATGWTRVLRGLAGSHLTCFPVASSFDIEFRAHFFNVRAGKWTASPSAPLSISSCIRIDDRRVLWSTSSFFEHWRLQYSTRIRRNKDKMPSVTASKRRLEFSSFLADARPCESWLGPGGSAGQVSTSQPGGKGGNIGGESMTGECGGSGGGCGGIAGTGGHCGEGSGGGSGDGGARGGGGADGGGSKPQEKDSNTTRIPKSECTTSKRGSRSGRSRGAMVSQTPSILTFTVLPTSVVWIARRDSI